jgi:hypothetical protein
VETERLKEDNMELVGIVSLVVILSQAFAIIVILEFILHLFLED